MTLDDALDLREGDYVVAHHAKTPEIAKALPVEFQPIRVTAIWVNKARTIVRVRLAAVDPNAWLDVTNYELPPKGKIWDRAYRDWCTKAEFRERHSPDLARRSRVRVVAEETGDA